MKFKEFWNEKVVPFLKKVWKPVVIVVSAIGGFFLYRNIRYRLSEAKRELDSARTEQREALNAVKDAREQQYVSTTEADRLTDQLQRQSRVLDEAEGQLIEDQGAIDNCRELIDESRRVIGETRSILEKYTAQSNNK